MRVGDTPVSEVLNLLHSEQAKRASQSEAQVNLLRKSLDQQKDSAAELLKMIEGKGQNLDIRV